MKRYERPTGTHGVYAGALISGAMDACRLGLAGPLPTAFLADAAYGYLPAEAQVAVSGDGDWLSGALDHARVRVRDVVAALQEVPRADGRGAVPGVLRLADYLEQHGGRTRERLCPPATFWESAAAHLADRWDLPRLASAAEARLRYRHAARLYAVAAGGAAGAAALVGLGTLQERCDDPRAARSTYRRAVEAGDGEAAARLARLAEQSGDRAEAERLVRLVGATASYRVYEVLLRLFEARLRNEEFAEAERFARELAVEGDEGYALSVLAHRFGSAGDRAESTRLLRAAADARNSAAMVSLALRCEEEGEQEEAERLLLAAAERGNQSAMTSLAIRREESGDREEAERYARRAGESGIGGALVGLAMRRDRRGETAEAERLALLAHRAGDREALTDLATRRLRAGDREGAERVCRTAADEGVGQGMAMLALLRDDAGDTGEAIEWARRADAEHFPYGFQWLIERWCAAGRDDEAGRLVAEARLWSTAVLTWERRGQGEQAEALARQAAAEGDWWPLTFLARLRSHDGRTEDAERLYRAAVDAGDVSALRGVAELRAGRGDRETARRLVRRAGALVRPHELIPLAELAAKISDRAGAERLYLAAAGAGTHGALAGLCGLRGEADRRRLRRCGLDGDGRLEQEEFDWPPLGPDCREP